MENKRLYIKEWNQMKKEEKRFLTAGEKENSLRYQPMLDKVIPDKLQETLNKAFYKAFGYIFEKGTGVIEKTYNKEKAENRHKLNVYANSLKETKHTVQAFRKQAHSTRRMNMAISTVEGVGLGVLGAGIPDIPLFLGVILKGIYEIAISYGYGYESEEEQIFILNVITAALQHGDDITKTDRSINEWIRNGRPFFGEKEKYIRKASDVLAEELLYLKFVQGIPVLGVIGGLSDTIYLHKITRYATLKYQRRFILDQNREK